MTFSTAGIGVAAGVKTAIGKAVILASEQIVIEPTWVASDEVDTEITRLESAIIEATEQLHSIRLQIPGDTPDDILEFIDTHLLMLNDRAIAEAPINMIREEACSAEWALHLHRNAMVRVFDEMDDPYLKTRKDDLDYVVNRVMNILMGRKEQEHQHEDIFEHIVIAEDLTPADAILLHHRGAVGFVTEHGSSMSHTAILARSMGIPAIVGAHGITTSVQQGETLVLDAENGILLAGCDSKDIDYFQQRINTELGRSEQLKSLRDTPAITADGLQLSLLANIELADDVDSALENSAQGIGLYRTEFLFMNRETLPTEEEHFHTYRRVVEAMPGLPVTIRTLDLGADKQASPLHADIRVCNPALGLRAIRLCLKEPDMFRVQIRGMLRASAYGEIQIMIPMLTNLKEARETRQIIDAELLALRTRGLELPDVTLGAMIETPAAALLANNFARYFDFLSIGTNDLVQYTLAVDRANDSVSHLYDSSHPAIIKLIADVIDAGKKQNTPVSICGEMAADLSYIPLLVGMGFTHLSIQPGSLLEVKNRLRSLNAQQLQTQVAELLQQTDVDLFEQQLHTLIN